MNQKIVLLDSDQVIANLLDSWCGLYNSRYDDALSVEEFGGTWSGLQNIVKPECGEKVYDLMKEEGFFKNLQPLSGAVEGVRQLYDDKRTDLYIVTAYSGHPEMAKGKVEFYEEHFPYLIEDDRIVLCKPKQLFYGDVLVDDSIENLEKFYKHMTDVIGKHDFYTVAMGAPHNKDAMEKPCVDVRVDSWPELMEYITSVILD